MQSSESLGLASNSLEPKPSIVQGVKYFKQLLAQGAAAIVDFYTILQAYNYDGGYIGFVSRNGGVHMNEVRVYRRGAYSSVYRLLKSRH